MKRFFEIYGTILRTVWNDIAEVVRIFAYIVFGIIFVFFVVDTTIDTAVYFVGKGWIAFGSALIMMLVSGFFLVIGMMSLETFFQKDD